MKIVRQSQNEIDILGQKVVISQLEKLISHLEIRKERDSLPNKKRTWLIQIRQNHDLMQAAAAEKCGISQSFYASIELGVRGNKLPVKTAMKIADALEFDWKLFYQDELSVSAKQQLLL